MELKPAGSYGAATAGSLLIVPYGIETCFLP